MLHCGSAALILCLRVARQVDFYPAIVAFRKFQRMMHELQQNLARRARLSTGAILAAIVLTIAALFALSAAIGRRDMSGYQIDTPVSPLTLDKVKTEAESLALPTANR